MQLDPQGLIARQDLFSVYVHTLPGFHFGSSACGLASGWAASQGSHRVPACLLVHTEVPPGTTPTTCKLTHARTQALSFLGTRPIAACLRSGASTAWCVRAGRGTPAETGKKKARAPRALPQRCPVGPWRSPDLSSLLPPAACLQAEAERRLLFAALADLRNQRFVLLSETCTPLYPPHVLYSQLLGETKSRVNACARPDGHVVDRWVGRWAGTAGARAALPLPDPTAALST